VTHTEALPDIDERTIEELWPPCALVRHYSRTRCDQPAAFIATLRCSSCRWQRKTPLCAAHAAHYAAGGHLWCKGCTEIGTPVVESLERLR